MAIKIEVVIDNPNFDAKLAKQISKQYSEALKESFKDVKGNFIGEIVLEPSKIGTSSSYVNIVVWDKNKERRFLESSRYFTKVENKFILKNYLLELDPSIQKLKIADKINTVGVSVLEKLGGDSIYLNANLDVGGYAWLRKGFWPTEGKQLLDVLVRENAKLISPELKDKWLGFSESEAKDYVLGKEFSDNFKPAFLGSDWNGSANISDPKIRALLTGQKALKTVVMDAAVTAQAQLWDASLRLHIYELKFGDTLSGEVSSLLAKTEADLEAKILQKLKKFVPPINSEDYKRLQELKSVLTAMRAESWNKALELMNKDILDLINHDQGIIASEISELLPVQVSVVLPGQALIKSLVRERPFQGKLLKEWAESMATKDIERITGAIQVGMVQGETTPQIVKRAFGTEGLKYADGVTYLAKNDIDAVVKTAISHYTNEARRELYVANPDIISEEQYVATLDGRTTPACRAYDGKLYKVGNGPQPPIHFRCRSLRIPQFNLASLSERPSNPATEKQLVREYAAANGLGVITARADLPRDTRTDFDAYSKKRKRQLIGTVSATETYQTWLKKQPVQFQEDVLGKEKARLFREDRLTLDKFISKQGNELTLAQLRERYPYAFKNANSETA